MDAVLSQRCWECGEERMLNEPRGNLRTTSTLCNLELKHRWILRRVCRMWNPQSTPTWLNFTTSSCASMGRENRRNRSPLNGQSLIWHPYMHDYLALITLFLQLTNKSVKSRHPWINLSYHWKWFQSEARRRESQGERNRDGSIDNRGDLNQREC